MKKKIGLLLSMLVIFLCQVCPQAVTDAAADEISMRAQHFLQMLLAGDFSAATRDFDATMAKAAPAEKLAEFWKALPAQTGAYKKQVGVRREKLDPYEIVLIGCEFEKVTFDLRVVFDKEKKIAGFQLVPPQPTVAYKAPDYAAPGRFSEREVTVGKGDWQLPGTLTLPQGAGPFAALVLVHGSGPNDRNEAIGPNQPFKDLAWGMASRGIAVLRYEKRTRIYGAKMVADPKLSASLTVKEESIDDALAAVQLLQGQKEIAPERIFVLGHSLGGMLIPRIAHAGRSLNIAGFIIMAGLTRRLEDTFIEQMTYILGLGGALSAESRQQIEKLQQQVQRIKTLRETDRPSTEKLLFACPSYWLDLRDYDPAAAARAIEKPLLVLQGGRDYQVTPEDFANWQKALAGKMNATFNLYPRLNHLFAEGVGMATPSEYMQLQKNVAEEVVTDIAAWINRQKR